MFRLESYRLLCNPEQELTSVKTQQRLNEVSNLLKGTKVITTKWFPVHNAIVLTFASGEIIWLFLNRSYLVTHVYVDRFLSKNKINNPLLDIYYGNDVIILAHADPYITVVTFRQRQGKFKLKYCDHINIKRIPLRDNRRCLNRHIVSDEYEDTFVIWWQCSAYGPTAWSTPDEPANVLVYSKLNDNNGHHSIELQSYAWVGSFISSVIFDGKNIKVATNESDGLHITTFDVTEGCAKIVSMIQIPLISSAISISFTGDLTRILILSENRSITMYNTINGTSFNLTNGTLEQGIILKVNLLNSYFILIDKRGQLLAYDLALSVIPANYDEYSSWPPAEIVDGAMFLTSQLMLLRMDSEELALISFPSVDTCGLMSMYLSYDYIDEAINLLRQLDWSEDGKAYACMVKLFDGLVRLPPNSVREEQIQSILAYFFRHGGRGARPYRSRVVSLLGKRFFLLLLRQNSMEKARALVHDLTRLGGNRPVSGLFHKVTSSTETATFEFV